jgi:hypothetical protein
LPFSSCLRGISGKFHLLYDQRVQIAPYLVPDLSVKDILCTIDEGSSIVNLFSQTSN